MRKEYLNLLKERCKKESYEALIKIENTKLHDFVERYVLLCNPDTVFVRTDSKEDNEYIRKKALENGEEKALRLEGHTVHFDGYYDQGRDKANTRYLLRPEQVLGSDIESMDREEGLKDIHYLLKDIMVGKEMHVCFFWLGPLGSKFSIPAVQITDSSYVVHAEGLLCRSGYNEFSKIHNSGRFFRFVHSAGRLENNISKDVYDRRMYIDLEEEMVYSANTQYAGNSIGLKKLAMRLAIKKASEEGWLTEHMFIMGVHGPKNKRMTYFTGSFPSACGKTATAMLEGEKIIGDDIAYLWRTNGSIHAVNVEKGIFGIIQDVNCENDPSIFEVLTNPGEVIFSNILVDLDNNPRWLGDNRPEPDEGANFSGRWFTGKIGPDDKLIPFAHKNARYTIQLKGLKNYDKNLENPKGVKIGGIIYGGRDSDTCMPVEESFDWVHGILTQAATIESETTAATLGKEGVREFNLMANLDFLSIPIGRYIQNNLDMVNGIKKPPRIFRVNYFLRNKHGKYLNGMQDKHVWIKWMELRVHDETSAVKTPTGLIPKYETLVKLFKEVLGKPYSKEEYEEQFKLRIPENLAKIERIKEIYHTKVFDTPHALLEALNQQKERLEECQKKHGDYVSPFVFE